MQGARDGSAGASVLALPFMLCGLLGLAACAETDGGRVRIGTLGAAGPNVFLNEQPAKTGTPVFVNDRVSTGAGSSAIVEFRDGGIAQLDENTDPLFLIRYLKNAQCILIQLLKGQVFVDEHPVCLTTPVAEVTSGSQINVRTTATQSSFVLLGGQLTVEAPASVPVPVGREAIVDGNPPRVRLRTLPARELQQVDAWRQRFQFTGWCVGGSGSQCGGGHFTFEPPVPNLPPQIPVLPPSPPPSSIPRPGSF